ncbi:MAG TPA: histidine phosphatase family protein [bacterium]|nr:histidine phosphatase family protein [bacterium]
MPRTVIYLIRHAETTWNVEGRLQGMLHAPLTERGVRQARYLVEALRSVPLAALYSSPLARAQATARPLSDAFGLPLQIVDDLREMNHGEWDGLLVDEVAAADGERLRAWRNSPTEVRFPGGECLADVHTRAMRAFDALRTRHRRETIAVVAHGGVNRAILLALQGAPLGDFWQIRQDNGCMNIIQVDEGRSRVVALNDTRHLAADA